MPEPWTIERIIIRLNDHFSFIQTNWLQLVRNHCFMLSAMFSAFNFCSSVGPSGAAMSRPFVVSTTNIERWHFQVVVWFRYRGHGFPAAVSVVSDINTTSFIFMAAALR